MFIKDPPVNLIASSNFKCIVPDESSTSAFGSCVCVANDLGGFNGHLANIREPEALEAKEKIVLDEFANNLDEMLLPNPTKEIEE